MSKFAIVILYDGLKPHKGTVAALHTALCESSVVSDLESVEIYDMSEEEVVAAIAVKPLCNDSTFFTVKGTVEQPITPEAKAVIVVSKQFGDIITKDDPMELMMKMSLEAQKSKYISPDHDLDDAIRVLSQPSAANHLKFKTKRETKLWESVLDVIQRVYHSVYNV